MVIRLHEGLREQLNALRQSATKRGLVIRPSQASAVVSSGLGAYWVDESSKLSYLVFVWKEEDGTYYGGCACSMQDECSPCEHLALATERFKLEFIATRATQETGIYVQVGLPAHQPITTFICWVCGIEFPRGISYYVIARHDFTCVVCLAQQKAS